MSKALFFFDKYVVVEIDAGQSFGDCVSIEESGDISDAAVRFNNVGVDDSYKFLAVPIDTDDAICINPPLVSKDGKNWSIALGAVKIDGEVFERVGEVRAHISIAYCPGISEEIRVKNLQELAKYEE